MRQAIFKKEHPDLDPSAEDDFWLDDGLLVGVVTIEGSTLTLHDVSARERAMQGARSGVGRRSLQGLRRDFPHIYASGVLHPLFDRVPDERNVASMMFWVAMLREGLIDRMCLMNDGVDIDRTMLAGPIEASFGTVSFLADGSYSFSPPPAQLRT